MKKCLHLKKTKPHWRRKPPKVVTWRERFEAERQQRRAMHSMHSFNDLSFAAAAAVMAATIRSRNPA